MKSLLAVVSLVALCGCEAGFRFESRSVETESDCQSIPREQSTGTIRCYSGGQLVYQTSIYHNGGVLCSVSGKEIKIRGGKSLCVIESWQPDNWKPPLPH